jgi:hypothetical protein
MLSQNQKDVLKKLIEIDKKLPEGVSLTFAVDNSLLLLEDAERDQFVRAIRSLIMAGYLNSHTNQQTDCGVPYWLELTKRGRSFSEVMSA